ncbi:TlpA disulfide reductase family protein [Flaviaesturariibacter amylovorans]|uniref:Thioredoxin domain-containing protein n=1 Tax=Flaviaesturariibacter amylovorans TaxID=1084520 RepID=A0ABP8GEC8_9BACT
MKRFFTLLLLLPAAAWSQEGFRISASIPGLKDSTEVKLLNTHQNNTVIATAHSKKGAFELRGQVGEPALAVLSLGTTGSVYVYVENTEMKLSAGPALEVKEKTKTPTTKVKSEGPAPDLASIRLEGSRSHADFLQFQAIFSPILGKVQSMGNQIQSTQDPALRNGLIASYDSVRQQLNNEVGRFVQEKRSSYVSPFLMYITAPVLDNYVVLNERFGQLDSTVRNSNIGRALGQNIANGLVGAIGSDALNFTQADTTGKPVSLASFKGKWVLLDFWASWCKPCRIENPNVVKAFQKFSNKNFTILGVSLDQRREAWIKAINDDKLTWTNVSDLQQWSNAVAQLYHVQGIPQNFLIDPNGKIVGKNLRGAELEAKLCELLGCN